MDAEAREKRIVELCPELGWGTSLYAGYQPKQRTPDEELELYSLLAAPNRPDFFG